MKTFSTQEKIYLTIIVGLVFFVIGTLTFQDENRIDKFNAIPDSIKVKVIQALEADHIPATGSNIIREYESHPEDYK